MSTPEAEKDKALRALRCLVEKYPDNPDLLRFLALAEMRA